MLPLNAFRSITHKSSLNVLGELSDTLGTSSRTQQRTPNKVINKVTSYLTTPSLLLHRWQPAFRSRLWLPNEEPVATFDYLTMGRFRPTISVKSTPHYLNTANTFDV